MYTKSYRQLDRRTFLKGATGATALAVVGIAGCGGGDNGTGEAFSYEGDVAVSHLAGTCDGAPLLIAREMGYLSEEGLELELVSFPGGSDTVRGITQGMAFGVPATVPVVEANVKAGADLRFIAGNNNTSTIRFVVPEGSAIQDLSDLRGKKIAVSRPGSLTTFFSDRLVRSVDLEPNEDVEILFVGGPADAWAAASQGVVDVAWSAPPFSTKIINQEGAREIALTSELVPAWADSLITAPAALLDEQPEIFEALIRALDRAAALIQEDPRRAAEAYSPTLELDVELTQKALTDSPVAWGTQMPEDAIAEIVAAAAFLGEFDTAEVDLDALVDTRFVSGD